MLAAPRLLHVHRIRHGQPERHHAAWRIHNKGRLQSRPRIVLRAGVQQLWDYAGSRVIPATLQQAQALQRRSFGHRNLRTYVLVVADPRSPACQAVEPCFEQLASGLAHERAAAVMYLDVSSPAAAQFAGRMLNVGSLPAVLVYPEGAPGSLAYRGVDMTAEGLLRALNLARAKALPEAEPYELRHAVAPLQRSASAAPPGGGLGAAVPLLQEPSVLLPDLLEVPRPGGYWGPGKAALWGLILAGSLMAWAWDAFLEDRWEAWRLARRMRQRREGVRRFTAAENLDDILSLLLARGAEEVAGGSSQGAEKQLGWRRLDDRGGSGSGNGSTGSGGGGVQQNGEWPRGAVEAPGGAAASVQVPAQAQALQQRPPRSPPGRSEAGAGGTGPGDVVVEAEVEVVSSPAEHQRAS